MSLTTGGFPNKGTINHSYDNLFKKIAKVSQDAKIIMEFGTGYSTILFHELWEKAIINSYENVSKWYEYHSNLIKDTENVNVYFTDNNPINSLVDIVFIDSNDTREKLYDFYSNSIYKPKILIVHDAQWYFNVPENKSGDNTINLDYSLWKYYIYDGDPNGATIAFSDEINFMKDVENDR